MQVTHKLMVTHDCMNIECLGSEGSLRNIAFEIVNGHRNEKFFIRLIQINSGQDEKIHGFFQEGNQYWIE